MTRPRTASALMAALLVAALAPAPPFGAHPGAVAQDNGKGGAGGGPSGGVAERHPITDVLKGQVLSFDGRVVEVKYDFKSEDQLQDFPLFKPIKVEGPFTKKWWDTSLNLKGTGGVVWRVVCRKSVEMDCEIRFAKAQDVGGFVGEDRVSDEYSLYSIFDKYFQNKDTPGSPKAHMICRFLRRAPDSGGDLAFRYIVRKGTPPVAPGKPLRFRFGRAGSDGFMEMDGNRMDGSDPWPGLRGLRAGFYVLENEAWVSSITLKGDVDPDWAKEAGVDLEHIVKPAHGKVEREPTDADRRAAEAVALVRTGGAPASGLIAIIENPALLESVREDAGKAMEEVGEAKLVPRLVPLLESEDLVCRRVADGAITKLSGKSFGFSPDAPAEKRRKSVRSLLDFIEKNPGRFR